MNKTGEMACGLNSSVGWRLVAVVFSLFSFDRLIVVYVDGHFMLQGKYAQKKQPSKGSNFEKNSSSHVSEKTGDEDNHGSHEYREDMPVVEVCISFVCHVDSILASIFNTKYYRFITLSV
jgi:hypothetical protein